MNQKRQTGSKSIKKDTERQTINQKRQTEINSIKTDTQTKNKPEKTDRHRQHQVRQTDKK